MRSRITALRAAIAPNEPAQIMVLFAIFLIVLLVLAGSAYDYASIVVDDAKLQNAVDAAVLAGSDSLSNNGAGKYGTPAAIAAQTASKYLSLNGVETTTPGTNINFIFPTSTPVPSVPTPSTPVAENITLNVTRTHTTAFWPLVGISSVTLRGGGSAHAAHGLIDVMLALDTTYSMQASQSITEEQNAVTSFVTAMNPNTGDPRSARIALANFQGLRACTVNNNGHTPPTPQPPVEPCVDNYTLISGLTGNAATLIAGGATLRYTDPGSASVQGGGGTKISDALTAVQLGTSSYVFKGTNSRNDSSIGGSGFAKKILIIMTDGENWDPTTVSGTPKPAWDTLLLNGAALVKKGFDGVAGTPDDVEIYTINYQLCNSSNAYDPVQLHNGNCESYLASLGQDRHECPSGVPFATAWAHMNNTPVYPFSSSPSDLLLFAASSSTPGTCDHFFPLSKGESLPALFTQLAGTISRGALTN